MSIELFRKLIPIISAVRVTLIVLVGSLSLGLLLGIVVALVEVYGNRFFSSLASLFQKIVRGIPGLLLLFLFYYGITLAANINMPPIIVAIIALGVRSSAYQSQIFKGVIQSIGVDQYIAARTLGMSNLRSILLIILPQAFRRAIGPWTNEYAVSVKSTAYAYIVGVWELLRTGRTIIAVSYGKYTMIVYLLVAFVYLFLCRSGNFLLYRLEDKLSIPGFERRTKR